MRTGSALTALVALVACGARTGLLVPTDTGDTAVGDGGSSCVGTAIPLDPNTPNLYFVLDASRSMQEENKWENVRSAVAALIAQLGTRAQFGAAVFPTQGADQCASGSQVMAVQAGDTQGATANTFLAATSFTPLGGTPTAATLQALEPGLIAFPQLTFAILATDGGPDCDAALSCGSDACTSNIDGEPGCPTGGPPNCCSAPGGGSGLGCLDGANAAQAVAALRAAGVPTFVMGIPGSAPYAAVLDALAIAGGGARSSEPFYYQVDTADTGALGAALSQIAARATASCAFTLTREPIDAGEVNVYLGDSEVPRDGAGGWSLQGTKLTLEGSTCAAIEAGSAPPVRVLEGCPTLTQ
jgi:hypothetical protein